MAENGNSVLRLLHYPEITGKPKGVRAAEHCDINFITLLVPSSNPGLEIKTRQGEWVPVTNPPDAIIVNAGDMLATYTKGRIPSTPHRVVNPLGRDRGRFSMPFFVHPRSEVVLRDEPRLTAGEFLDERLRAIGVK